MLEAGQAAPDFTLPDQNGEELTLSDLRGETVVLYFYPRADTMSYNCSNGHAGRHRHHPSL
jgi:peroxiredoxin Q/BCP